jgi:hypothetical protein
MADGSTTNHPPSSNSNSSNSSSSSSRLLPLLTRRAQQQQQQRQWQQLLLWSAFSQDGSSSQQLATLEAPAALPLSGDGTPPYLQATVTAAAAAAGDEWRAVQQGPAAGHSSSLIIPNNSSSGSSGSSGSSRSSGSISDTVDAGAFLMRAKWREGNAATAHQPLMLAKLLPPLLHDHHRSPAVAFPATSSLPVISADVSHNAMPAAALSATTSPQQQQQQQQQPVLLSVTAGLLGGEDYQTGGSRAAELYDRLVGQRKEAALEAGGMRLLNSRSDDQPPPPAVGGPVQDTPADLAPPPADLAPPPADLAPPPAAPGGSPEPQAKGGRSSAAFNSFQFVDAATQERLQADVEDFTSASSRFTQSLGKFFQLLFELVLKVATFTVKITVKLLVWLLDQAKQAQVARVQQARQQRTQLLAAPAALLQPPQSSPQPPLPLHVALQAAAPHSAASCI